MPRVARRRRSGTPTTRHCTTTTRDGGQIGLVQERAHHGAFLAPGPASAPPNPRTAAVAAGAQELAKQVDPNLTLDSEAHQVCDACTCSCSSRHSRPPLAFASQVLQDIAEDFVENVAAFACELVKHREGDTLEVKDLQLAIGAMCCTWAHPGPKGWECRRGPVSCRSEPCLRTRPNTEKNWNMRLPGIGDNELRQIKKSSTTEVHRQRSLLVRRSQTR